MNELWFSEVKAFRFFATRSLLFVTAWCDLSDERKEAWTTFLKAGYPSKRIVFGITMAQPRKRQWISDPNKEER